MMIEDFQSAISKLDIDMKFMIKTNGWLIWYLKFLFNLN